MRRVTVEVDSPANSGEALTYNPGFAVKAARGVVETMRLLAPMFSAMLLAATLGVYYSLLDALGFPLPGSSPASCSWAWVP